MDVSLLPTIIPSLFTLLTLASDYTLLFDHFILQLNLPLRASWEKSKLTASSRWRATLQSCLVYAVLETLAYWGMTSISDLALWWLPMACFLHISGVSGFFEGMFEVMKELKDQHEAKCDSPGGEERYRDDDEESDEKSTRSTPTLESNPESSQTAEASSWTSFRSCGLHTPPWYYHFLSLIPITTAAMTNASLLFYTRFLASSDSTKWQQRFLFGWCMIAFVCAFAFGGAKFMNRSFYAGQPKTAGKDGERWRDYAKRAGNLGVLLIVRGGLRWMMGQDVVAFPKFGEKGGPPLVLHADVEFRSIPIDEPLGAEDHLFDRILSAIPPWVGQVCIWGKLCFMAGLWWWRRREAKKEKLEKPC